MMNQVLILKDFSDGGDLGNNLKVLELLKIMKTVNLIYIYVYMMVLSHYILKEGGLLVQRGN